MNPIELTLDAKLCPICGLPIPWSGWCDDSAHGMHAITHRGSVPYGTPIEPQKFEKWAVSAVGEALFGWIEDATEEQEAAEVLRLLRLGAIDLAHDLSRPGSRACALKLYPTIRT